MKYVAIVSDVAHNNNIIQKPSYFDTGTTKLLNSIPVTESAVGELPRKLCQI